MRRTVAGLAGVALLLAALLPGCGTGLTGGSIPTGPTRASGQVVRGDNAASPLANAIVRFQPLTTSTRATTGPGDSTPPSPPAWSNDPDPGDPIILPITELPGTVKVTSNDSGTFATTSLPTGAVRVVVSPPDGSGLAAIGYEIAVAAGDAWYLVCAPLPQGLSTAGLSDVSVAPAAIDLAVGEAVQITVHLAGGAPPAIVPSYLLRGDIGVINSHGRFAAVRAGRGALRVVVGPFQRQIPVTVREVVSRWLTLGP